MIWSLPDPGVIGTSFVLAAFGLQLTTTSKPNNKVVFNFIIIIFFFSLISPFAFTPRVDLSGPVR